MQIFQKLHAKQYTVQKHKYRCLHDMYANQK